MLKLSTLAQFEAVDGAFSSLISAGDFMSCADPRVWIRKSNLLSDACVDAGMSHDEPDHHDWAARFLVRHLASATSLAA